jgi:hypothetical protein
LEQNIYQQIVHASPDSSEWAVSLVAKGLQVLCSTILQKESRAGLLSTSLVLLPGLHPKEERGGAPDYGASFCHHCRCCGQKKWLLKQKLHVLGHAQQRKLDGLNSVWKNIH